MLKAENHELYFNDRHQSDDDDASIGYEEYHKVSNEDDEFAFSMSSDLLEKECQLQNQNKELQSRTKKVVEEAEKVVRGGKETLNQSTYSAVKDQDNIDNLRSAKKLTPASKFLAKCKLSKPMSSLSTNLKPIISKESSTATLINSMSSLSLDLSPRTKPTVNSTDNGLYANQTSKKDDINLVLESGPAATQRFLNAKVSVLQKELDSFVQQVNAKDAELKIIHEKLIQCEEEKKGFDKIIETFKLGQEKMKAREDKSQGRKTELEAENASLKKDLVTMSRQQTHHKETSSNATVRLNRALENFEKLKATQLKKENEFKDQTDLAKRNLHRAISENKRLIKQKEELIAAFKKSMALVECLKRQKIHIESAKVLQFTEDEFVEALEWEG